MAVIQTAKTVKPTTINKFLGLNLSDTGDTQIVLGESGNMKNFYITDDLKLRKAHGYKTFHHFTHSSGGQTINDMIKGMFSTKIGNTQYLLVASHGKLYKFLQSELDNDYLVDPKKKKIFKGNGSTTTFSLGLTNIESIEGIYVKSKDESQYIEVEEYTENLTSGTVTLDTAPENDSTVAVYFTKHIEATEIGNISDVDTSFFEFDNKVYILAGDYYKWDGTTMSQVEGYIPTVYINTPPGGGGTIYEEINILTPKKKQTFNGDGTSTTYQLAEKGITSVLSITVGGTSVPSTGYSVNTTNGTVTFTTAPAQGYDNVEITWSKDANTRTVIQGMKFGTVFGGDVDTRVFLYGNSSYQNRVYYSGITMAGNVAVPSVEYFPATAFIDIGPSNFAVTDLTRQYDRLLATTNKPEAYYLTISMEQLPITLDSGDSATRYVPSVGTFPLNGAHGNVALGQGQLINNYPVTFEDGEIIQWKATNVRDEKNMESISTKIKKDLDGISMRAIKTLDLQEFNQLWVIYDTKVWIYNYYNKTFSRLVLPVSVDNITSMTGNVYMSTTEGKVIKFSKNFTKYDDEIIDAYWEMNFADFGVPYLRKTMNRLWVQMQPSNWASADISFVTNRAESQITKHIQYKLQWFDNVHFGDWHFTASINPQPFKLKLKAKKFTNLKLTIKNTEESVCTILTLVLQVESFGYSK